VYNEQQIRLLLPGGPDCLVIVTSRRMLDGLDIAEQFGLQALNTRHALELLARMAGEERISADREAAEQIAEYCGYLPLALRIAGARLRSRPAWQVRDLADRLADEHRRLDELRAGDRDTRGSFALSYRALSPPLARAFRLLGLIPGIDFGQPAVAAVLGCPLRTAGSLVEELVDVALLETGAAGRYRFHDLIRLFAREQAVADEDEPQRHAALDRVLRMYRDSASGWLDRALGEYRPHPDAVTWFDVDGLNALDAAEAAYQHGTWDIVTDLATALHHVLSLQGRAAEMERLLSLAVAAAARAGDHRAEIHAQVLRAEFMLWHGRATETQPMYDRALALAAAIADEAVRAWVLTHRGDAYREIGELAASRACYEEALRISLADGDRARQGWVLTHLALTMHALGQSDAALDMFGQALAIGTERNDSGNRAWVLTHMAGALDGQSRTREADAALHEALGIMRRNDDLVGQEWVLDHFGAILLERQSWNAAAAVFRQAAGIAERRADAFAVNKWTEKASWASTRASEQG
jgi:tetratricopeptide (TPR) repeat protein